MIKANCWENWSIAVHKSLKGVWSILELEDVIKVHSIGYGLEDVKVEFKHDLKMDVSGVQIDGKENEMMNIPRWVADILESEKHIILH